MAEVKENAIRFAGILKLNCELNLTEFHLTAVDMGLKASFTSASVRVEQLFSIKWLRLLAANDLSC